MICSFCGAERRTSLCSSCGQIHAAETPKPKPRRKPPAPAKLTSLYAGVQHRLRGTQADRDAILLALRQGPLTRDALSERTGIDINVVTPRVVELLRERQIVELSRTAPTRKHVPAFLLELADPSRPREAHGVLAKDAQQGLGLEEAS